jgi:hypothetical protein
MDPSSHSSDLRAGDGKSTVPREGNDHGDLAARRTLALVALKRRKDDARTTQEPLTVAAQSNGRGSETAGWEASVEDPFIDFLGWNSSTR